MNLEVDDEKKAQIEKVITSEDSPVGIDAKKTYNQDDAFIILIDGREVPYREISTNVDSRTIIIEFQEGDSDIKIIGTFVI